MLWTYPRALEPGIFVKRYKRFFTDVERSCGLLETVHCANSGSMLSCLDERCPVFTLDSQNPERKLRHSLELMKYQDGFACLNTARANQIVEVFLNHAFTFANTVKSQHIAHLDSFQQKLIHTDFLHFGLPKRESVYLPGTRFDFSCDNAHQEQKHWIEVKSVSLRLGSGSLAFPDAKTERGQKHLVQLTHAASLQQRSTLIFVAMRGSETSPHEIAQNFKIAGHIDPVYLRYFKEAVASGVQIRILVPDISPTGFGLRGYFNFASF